MKKTIFLAVALSLILCGTTFAGDTVTPVHGQKVAVNVYFHTYTDTQARNTRMFIRNLDPGKSIYVWRVILINRNGTDMCFEPPDEDYFCYFVGDPEADAALSPREGPILLHPYESASFAVPIAYAVDWENVVDGGRPFFVVWWYAENGDDVVTPAEIWAVHRNVSDGVRVSIDLWEGRVVEVYQPEKVKIK